jgi:hypothetical protein
MDRDMEIQRLRHELEVLRNRYAIYQRGGRRLRIYFMIWFPLFALLIAALLVKVVLFDPYMGGFLIALTVIVLLTMWLVSDRKATNAGGGRSRWVDLASTPLSPFSLTPGIPAFSVRRRSDAEIVEEQIAARERRLAELEMRS